MRALLMTLGHNSSIAVIDDGKLQFAYETERITGVKSDSRFPLPFFEQRFAPIKFDVAYVTHWDPYGNLYGMSSKYWNPTYVDGVPVRTLSHEFSHHDAHAEAALRFARNMVYEYDLYLMVIDGFGTFGEHFSVYKVVNGKLDLQTRLYGYDSSLGLLYQYATAFMGLKMHEDEYKLLGYEVKIDKVLPDQKKLMEWVTEWVVQWAESPAPLYSPYDPIFNLNALKEVRDKIFRSLQNLLNCVNMTNPTSEEARVVIAYAVQKIVEMCVMIVVDHFNPTNLIVTGGVHLNVKLNKLLLDRVPGMFCAYPLAGDQGNAFGLYAHDHPHWIHPTKLTLGPRNFQGYGVVEGIHWVNSDEAFQLLTKYLDVYGRVNLVRGAMEFGPRALCNTSTLAKPTRQQVDVINRANNRNTVMPMAPVMNQKQYERSFLHTNRVYRSHEYMIVAMEYREDAVSQLLGVAHEYTQPRPHYTGRPQVITDDQLMEALLTVYGPLINTSFNYHGKPIAFDVPEIVENHRLQRARDPDINTVVVVEE